MRITFILTGSGHRPIGGFKVVYEYANRLAKLGHAVAVVHPASVMNKVGAVDCVKKTFRYVQRRIDHSFLPRRWFAVDPGVTLLWVRNLSEKYIPDADVIIATGAPTAEWVNGYSPSKGRKYYFLQHYESWDPIGALRLRATYSMPLTKIAIAHWLCEIAAEIGNGAVYIPNGLDSENFYVERPVTQRNASHGIMLYHTLPEKGIQIGLAACELAREQIPGLSMTMFGVYQQPKNLPPWIRYVKSPGIAELRSLYNEASFVLAPSNTEGWGLVPCEAMTCGCALIATDAGGHREFAIDHVTALVAPVGQPQALATRIKEVVTDDALRYRLSEAGQSYLRRYSWDESTRLFEHTLENVVDHV
jgi:glycosyltransferase involved in cell wall biosynthesis